MAWRSQSPQEPVDAEAYLDLALTQWLVQASEGQTAARQALHLLADTLSERFRDPWLRDVLDQAAAQSWSGFSELGQAVRSNVEGQAEQAQKQARLAEAHFALGSPAWLRAMLEETYALHRLGDGNTCVDRARTLGQALTSRAYPWTRIQSDLELSVCASMLGDFAAARPPLQNAERHAPPGYGNLNLRTLGLQGALETVSGNTISAWRIDRKGLARYFSGDYAAVRGYQFYSDLSFVAQRQGRWHLATFFASEAQQLLSSTGNRPTIARAAQWHGALARTAGMMNEATDAFALAARLYSENPSPDAAVAIYRADGEIAQADIEARLGDWEQARTHLRDASAAIPLIHDVTVTLRYYQTLGLLLLREGSIDKSQKAFEQAIEISRNGLSTRATPSARAAWTEVTRRAHLGLVEVLLRKRNKPLEALRIWEQYRSSVLAPGSRLRIPRFGRGKTPDYSVLTYAVFYDGVAIWLFDGSGVVFRWADVRDAEFRGVAERFAAACADPASSRAGMQRDGLWLYDRLIGPVAVRLPLNRTLLIEPDDAISQIPFAALPGASHHWLGEEHPLAISLGPGEPLRASVTGESKPLIVGAASLGKDWTADFPPLAEASREAQTIADLFAHSSPLVANAATLADVRSRLPRAELFHFAGHAVADETGGALLLADESGAAPLGAPEIAGLRLRQCKLAVLSACDTASGDSQGLAGAFLKAGVRQVVAARWVVDSSATRSYMERMYRTLLSSSNVPLVRVMFLSSSALREQTATSHPSFWAGFELYEAASPWKP